MATEESCCTSEESCEMPAEEQETCEMPTNGEEQESPCEQGCNPFMSCSGCLYEMTVKQEFAISKPVFKPDQNGHKDANFISEYLSIQWQPPEVV